MNKRDIVKLRTSIPSLFENMSKNEIVKLKTYLSSFIEADGVVFTRVDDIHWEIDGSIISERDLIKYLFKFKEEQITFR